jgi:hypothetical protein
MAQVLTVFLRQLSGWLSRLAQLASLAGWLSGWLVGSVGWLNKVSCWLRWVDGWLG